MYVTRYEMAPKPGSHVEFRERATKLNATATEVLGTETSAYSIVTGTAYASAALFFRYDNAVEGVEVMSTLMASEEYQQQVQELGSLLAAPAEVRSARIIAASPDYERRPFHWFLGGIALPGKRGPAVEQAQALVGTVHDITGQPVVSTVGEFGSPSELWLSIGFDNGSQYDEAMAKLEADDGYREKMAKLGEIAVPDSAVTLLGYALS